MHQTKRNISQFVNAVANQVCKPTLTCLVRAQTAHRAAHIVVFLFSTRALVISTCFLIQLALWPVTSPYPIASPGADSLGNGFNPCGIAEDR